MRIRERHAEQIAQSWGVLFSVNLYAGVMKKVTFTLPADAPRDGTVQVAGEHRSLERKDGKFTDDFVGHAHHIYRIK